MKLKSIILENFRSFSARIKVDVGDLTALIGKNDAGKSTILEALEIFFNNSLVKIDPNDCNVFSQTKTVTIGCVFGEIPDKILLDSATLTNLSDEFLLNEDGDIEIHKVFDCSLKAPKSKNILVAKHPTLNNYQDLLVLKQAELKKRIKDLKIEGVLGNASMARMRRAIWETKSRDELMLSMTEITLDKDNGTKIWDGLNKSFPLYALFQSDRSSKDSDDEVQDPMKIAVDEAIQSVQDQLEVIKQQVITKATEVAQRTLSQLQTIKPDLANQLSPKLISEPKWEGFKLSLIGDDDIPINKRGSGARRLVLLSFFMAEAEKRKEDGGCSDVIYAIEEPETSQHPNHQELLVNTLIELSESCQVLLTTHVPALAGLLSVDSLRYITKENGQPVIQSGSDEVYKQICQDLGVLPYPSDQIQANNIKVIVCVEGKHDISFLNNICRILRIQDPSVPDVETDSRIIILPLGGSNLKTWAQNNFLRSFQIPEIHIYDRDDANNPQYQSACDEVNNRGDNSWATLTSKREMESYLHPDAINTELSLTITASDIVANNDNVPELIVNRIQSNPVHPLRQKICRRQTPKERKNEAKKLLNNQVVLCMTIAMLAQSDPQNDIKSWFQEIAARLP